MTFKFISPSVPFSKIVVNMISRRLALFSSTTSFSCCDTVIYNTYIFWLPPIPGTEILKLSKYLVMTATKVSFVMSMLTFGKHRWGLVIRGTNPVLRGVELSVVPHKPLGRGERLGVESITNG